MARSMNPPRRAPAMMPIGIPISDADDDGAEDDAERHREPALDLAGDVGAGDEALAEVEADGVLEPVAVLHQERVVEAQLLAHLFDLLRGRVLAAGELCGGIAGHEGDQRVHPERHEQQRRDQQQQAPADQGQHVNRPSSRADSPRAAMGRGLRIPSLRMCASPFRHLNPLKHARRTESIRLAGENSVIEPRAQAPPPATPTFSQDRGPLDRASSGAKRRRRPERRSECEPAEPVRGASSWRPTSRRGDCTRVG